MTTGIDKIKGVDTQELTQFWNDYKPFFDDFGKKIGAKPKQGAVKKNQYANNAEYVEIGYLEMKLDQVFHGQWSWEITDAKQVLNAFHVTGTLSVLHPVSGVWLKRSGIAAKQITLAKGMKDFIAENMASKTLERDIPIAAAEAFKNAAKKIGNLFGRHLNRGFNFDYIEDKEDIFSKKL